jgi:hypothetical protein
MITSLRCTGVLIVGLLITSASAQQPPAKPLEAYGQVAILTVNVHCPGGKVQAVAVKKGQTVKKGQVLAQVMDDKDTTALKASVDGVVAESFLRVGDTVTSGTAFRIEVPGRREVRMQCDRCECPDIRSKCFVLVDSPSGVRQLTGLVESVGFTDPATEKRPVIIHIGPTNDSDAPAVGAFVRVRFGAARK